MEQKDAYIRELLDNSALYQTLKYCKEGWNLRPKEGRQA